MKNKVLAAVCVLILLCGGGLLLLPRWHVSFKKPAAVSEHAMRQVTNETAARSDTPQFRMENVCYITGGGSCKGKTQEGMPVRKSGKSTCGTVGRVSEITWSFVEHRNGRDVYSFSRRFPIDSDSEKATLETNVVQFNGERLIVFVDNEQTIVIQSPTE